MKKIYEEMVDKEIDNFYLDKDESDKNFKLLIEFESSNYDYVGSLFEFNKNMKKVIKAKEVKIGKHDINKLF